MGVQTVAKSSGLPGNISLLYVNRASTLYRRLAELSASIVPSDPGVKSSAQDATSSRICVDRSTIGSNTCTRHQER